MLANIKAWPAASSPRAIPYGGLGGCVEVRNDLLTAEHNSTHDASQKSTRRKPASIVIQQRGTGQDYRTSQIPRSATTPAVVSRSPMESGHPRTPQSAKKDGNSPPPYDAQEGCNKNQWLTPAPRPDLILRKPVTRRRTLPVELPGSLLLPSQGFAQSNPPNTPPPSTKPPRNKNSPSDSSLMDPPGSTRSDQSSPVSPEQSRPVVGYSSHTKPLFAPTPSRNVPKPLALLNIEQLLRVLPSLDVREIVVKWMGTVERELTAFRSFSMQLSMGNQAQLMALPSFCKELTSILRQAKTMCEKHSPEFTRAQESTDSNNQSDATKIAHYAASMSDLLSSILIPGLHLAIRECELEEMRSLLIATVRVISGFVRNQLTFELHRLCNGLSNEMVQCLRNFDRKPVPSDRASNSEDLTTAVPAVLGQPLTTSAIFTDWPNSSASPGVSSGEANQQSTSSRKIGVTSPGLQLIVSSSDVSRLQDAVDMCLNTQNTTNPADDGSNIVLSQPSNAETDLSILNSRLDNGKVQSRDQRDRQFSQFESDTANSSPSSRSPSTPPLSVTTSTPVSPPTAITMSPTTYFPFPFIASSASSCYSTPSFHVVESDQLTTLTIQTPPREKHQDFQLHYHHRDQSQTQQTNPPQSSRSQRDELATLLTTRDAEITSLRSQLLNLETQNRLLTNNVSVLARQIEHLRIGLRESPSAGANGCHMGKFKFKHGPRLCDRISMHNTGHDRSIGGGGVNSRGGAVHIAHMSLNANRGVMRADSKRRKVVTSREGGQLQSSPGWAR